MIKATVTENGGAKGDCIIPECDNNGTIPNQIAEDKWEPQRCQWCDENKETRYDPPETIKGQEVIEVIDKETGQRFSMNELKEVTSNVKRLLDHFKKSTSVVFAIPPGTELVEIEEPKREDYLKGVDYWNEMKQYQADKNFKWKE